MGLGLKSRKMSLSSTVKNSGQKSDQSVSCA